ncbi:hypothetical protein YC2023_063252 [Brassica napus]
MKPMEKEVMMDVIAGTMVLKGKLVMLSHQVLTCLTNEEFSFSFDDFSGNTNDANGRRIKTHPIDMVITIATDMIRLSTISTGKRQGVITWHEDNWDNPESKFLAFT